MMLTDGIGLELLEFVLFIHRGVERVDIYIYCSSEKGFFLHVVMLWMWRLYGTSLCAELEALRRVCGASALQAECMGNGGRWFVFLAPACLILRYDLRLALQ